MLSVLLVILAIVYLAICVVWSLFMRKHRKTRIRFFGILISFVLAFVGILITKSVLSGGNFATDTLIPLFRSNGGEEFADLLQQSPALCDTIVGCISALALPILMLVVFLIFDFFSWIVFLLISLLRGTQMKEKEESTPYAKQRTAALAVVQALLVLVVWMIPIATYAEIAPAVLEGILDAVPMKDDEQQLMNSVTNDYVKPIDQNGMVRVFRVLGVSALSDTMTTFDVNGVRVHFRDEIRSVTTLICNGFQLAETEMTEYGEAEIAALESISTTFGESKLLPVVVGELLHNATGAWKNGDSFIGVGEDVIRFDESGMFDDFITAFLDVIYQDTAVDHLDSLRADVGTASDLMQLFIRKNVLSNTGDIDTLVDILTQNSVIGDMVLILGENTSMKVLIPEVTNIGIRAIGTALEIKEDDEALYEDLMTALADGLNAARTEEDREAFVSRLLHEQFENAGILAEESVLQFYADAMIKDLLDAGGDTPVGTADVTAFFAVYAWSVSEHSDAVASSERDTSEKAPVDLATLRPLLRGTVYERMTDSELAACSAAILATKQQIPADTVSATASLYDPSVTESVLVTLDMLLINPKFVAEHLNGEKLTAEATSLQAVFDAVNRMMEDLDDESSELDMEAVSEPLGSVLDSLAQSTSYGKEKTALLFIALMQSEVVRDSANLDMDTATRLGLKGSDGDDLNYSETFHTIAMTVSILQTMEEDGGELKQEDIVKMIENINQQSAAMIEIYITPDRMTEDYNMKAEHSATAAPLLSNTFGYLANNEVEDYDREAEAINQVMSLTMAARDNANDPESNRSLFGEDGVLSDQGSTDAERAANTIEILMASESVAHSVNTTPYEEDPFELSDLMQQDENQDDAQTLKDAMRDYYSVPENHTEENRETLIQIGNLFGLSDVADVLN